MTRLSAAVSLSLGLSLCLPAASAQAAPAPWTIAVYLNADHNLDGSALADLEEMEKAGGGQLKNLQIVYYLDRNENEEGAEPGVELGIIKNGKRQVVQKLPEQNSDDPKVLTNFITWAYKNYPSQKRGLILWDHGGQWDGGFGGDEHGPGIVEGGEHRALTGAQTAAAVAAGLKSLNIGKFDFLAFDTCLMAGAELVAQFSPLTRLYIADAELDFGDGWDYTESFAYLDKNPNASVQDFGKAEVRFWEAQHLASGGQDDLTKRTQAAFDTALWPAVQTALSDFAVDLKPAVTDPKRRDAVLRARGEAYEYGFNSDSDKPGTRQPYIDLGDFAARLAKYTTDVRLRASAGALSAAINKMTVAKSIGNSIPGAAGLSIYLPLTKSTLPDNAKLLDYAKLDVNADLAWSGLASAWTSALKGISAPIALKNIAVSAKGAGYHLEFTPSGPNLDAVLINLYSIRGDTTTDYGDLYFQKTTEGKKTFDWTPFVWSISDGKAASLLTADRDSPSDPIYSADALYSASGEQPFDVTLRFDPSGQVSGALDSSGISPIGITLKPGGTLQFYTRTYKGNEEQPSRALQAAKLTIPASGLKGLKALKAPLPTGGEYELAFTVLDLVGNDEGEAVALAKK